MLGLSMRKRILVSIFSYENKAKNYSAMTYRLVWRSLILNSVLYKNTMLAKRIVPGSLPRIQSPSENEIRITLTAILKIGD